MLLIKSSSITGVAGGTTLSVQGTTPTAFTRQVKSYVPINDVMGVAKEGYL
jgi:hypothetical protein